MAMQNTAIALSGPVGRPQFASPRRKVVFGRRAVRVRIRQLKPARLNAPFGLTSQHIKEFLMAYCACFMAVMGLIA